MDLPTSGSGTIVRCAVALAALTFVAETFPQDLRSGATVDRHVADQLVLFAVLAQETSRYLVPRDEHLATNLWLIGRFGARGVVDRRQVVIDGLGLTRLDEGEGRGRCLRAPTA